MATLKQKSIFFSHTEVQVPNITYKRNSNQSNLRPQHTNQTFRPISNLKTKSSSYSPSHQDRVIMPKANNAQSGSSAVLSTRVAPINQNGTRLSERLISATDGTFNGNQFQVHAGILFEGCTLQEIMDNEKGASPRWVGRWRVKATGDLYYEVTQDNR